MNTSTNGRAHQTDSALGLPGAQAGIRVIHLVAMSASDRAGGIETMRRILDVADEHGGGAVVQLAQTAVMLLGDLVDEQTLLDLAEQLDALERRRKAGLSVIDGDGEEESAQ